MVKVLFKDEYGNKLIERKDGAIGVVGERNKYISKKEFGEFIKENKLGNKIRLRKGGMLWVHNNLLN